MPTIPHTFGTYPAGNFPAADWDTNFNFVAALTNIFCTAIGANSIALTPAATSPTITAYQTGMVFTFVAGNNNTGATTIAVSALPAKIAYNAMGVALIGGEISGNGYYQAVYDQALNGSVGGFRVSIPAALVPAAGIPTAQFVSRSTAAAANLAGLPVGSLITTTCFATAGDGGGGVYIRTSSLFLGSNLGCFTAADGSFWKLQGPEINILQFGAIADTDPTIPNINSNAAFTDCFNFANQSGSGVSTIVLGRGEVYSLTVRPPTLTRNFEITGKCGQLAARSTINKFYVEASATLGLLSFNTFLPTIRDLAFVALGGSGGSMISFINLSATSNAGNAYLSNLNISTGNNCNYGLRFDGSAASGASAPGCRNIYMVNVTVFGASLSSVSMICVRNVFGANLSWTDVGGSVTNGAVRLDGATAPGNNDNINLTGFFSGTVIEFSNRVKMFGPVNSLVIDNSSDIAIYGDITSGIQSGSSVSKFWAYGRIDAGGITGLPEDTNFITDAVVARSISISFKVLVDFNAANTDTQLNLRMPPPYTRYRVLRVNISGSSGSLTTATVGLFTATGGGGIAIVPAASAITVTTGAENTNNNSMLLPINNQTTQSYNLTALFVRVANPQGSAATAWVTVQVNIVS